MLLEVQLEKVEGVLQKYVPGVQGKVGIEVAVGEEELLVLLLGETIIVVKVVSRAMKAAAVLVGTRVVVSVLREVVGTPLESAVTVIVTVTVTGPLRSIEVEVEVADEVIVMSELLVSTIPVLVVSAVVVKSGTPVPAGVAVAVVLSRGKGARVEFEAVSNEAVETGAAVVAEGLDPVITKPGPASGATASSP